MSRNWSYLRGRWRDLGWPLYEGDSVGPRFRAAEARNAAIRKGDGEIVFVVDADVLVNPLAAEEAVELAAATGGYVVAHTDLDYLDADATHQLIDTGVAGDGRVGSYHRTWFGAFAVPRALFEKVGGYDERFGEWGQHAMAFWFACRTLGGHNRVPGSAVHLWHPPRVPVTTDAAEALYLRYEAADGDLVEMAKLVWEPR